MWSEVRVRIIIPYGSDGRYLLELLTNPKYSNTLGMVRHMGGGVDKTDPNPKHAAIRELKEEIGHQAEPDDLVELGTIPHSEWDCDEVYYLLKNHDIEPGTYKDETDPDNPITLVLGIIDDPRYFGPEGVEELLPI